jgi:NAD(P)-dependent dehydrogenase (short-subunit alcohol dehydrogenase family)
LYFDLSGLTALVAGPAAGIGGAVATTLVGAGAAVVVADRDRAAVAALVDELSALPGAEVSGVAADLGTAEGAAAVLAAVSAVDLLVMDAAGSGGLYTSAVPMLGDAEWRRFFERPVLSGIRLTSHYLAEMAARGSGRVVFVCGGSVANTAVQAAHQDLISTSQVVLGRGLAQAMAGTGVTVNVVLAGATRPQMGELSTPQEAGPDRLLEPGEVANLVLYAISGYAPTGAVLRVDGGAVPLLMP